MYFIVYSQSQIMLLSDSVLLGFCDEIHCKQASPSESFWILFEQLLKGQVCFKQQECLVGAKLRPSITIIVLLPQMFTAVVQDCDID